MILTGKRANNLEEATELALQTAGVTDMDTGTINMFRSVANSNKLNSEGDKLINSAVKSRNGAKATWRAERWFVPVPKLSYNGHDILKLVIEVNVYLVAKVEIDTRYEFIWITLVSPVGKPEVLNIPVLFLHAVLEKYLGRLAVVAKDAVYTTWEIPGAGLVRLPNDFIEMLSNGFNWQSVVSWLADFGAQGKKVAPLIAGTLFGLAFQDTTASVAANNEVVTTDKLTSALEAMAYTPAEIKDMIKRAAPQLSADTTLEEAIRITLQRKGED